MTDRTTIHLPVSWDADFDAPGSTRSSVSLQGPPGEPGISSGDLTTALSGYPTKANNLSDLPSKPTARTNLGLGTAATHAATDFATPADLTNFVSGATVDYSGSNPFLTGIRGWVRRTRAKILTLTATALGAGELMVDEQGNVYGGDGSTVISALKRLMRIDELVIDVRTRGAKGDATAVAHNNGTDDTAALVQAASDCHAAGGGTVLIPKVLVGFRITAQIQSWYPDVRWVMFAPVIYDGPANQDAIQIGHPTNRVANENLDHKVWVKRVTASNWSNDADCGVAFFNPYNSNIVIRSEGGFTIAARIVAAGTGAYYNKFFLRRIGDARVGLRIDSVTTGGVQGANNENNFFGGNFSVNTGVNPTIARYGIEITSTDATYLGNNNHRFHAPSFELNGGGTVEAIPLLVTYGSYNWMRDARHESASSTSVVIRTLNNSQDNEIGFSNLIAASFPTMDDQGANPSSVISRVGRHASIELARRPVAKFANLHRKACYYDGNTKINVPGLSIATAATSVDDAAAQSGLVIAPDYLEVPTNRMIGVYVDTRVVKSFAVFQDTDTNFGGRMFVRCYDNTGTVLTSAGAHAPYVASTSNSGLTYSTARGGSYLTGADILTVPDAQNGRYFRVGADVDHIFLGLGGGTAAMRIRGFSIFTSVTGECSTWAVSHTGDERNYGTAAPTAGTWEAGRKVFNDAPTTFEGWVCTAAGSPGTWTQFGAVGSVAPPINPAIGGLKGWSADNANLTGSGTILTSGVLTGSRLWLPNDASITNLLVILGAAGSGLTAGQSFAALYDLTGNLLGVTADQSSAWTSTGTKIMAIVGGPLALTAGFYDVCFWSVGTTPPRLQAGAVSSLVNNGLAAASSRFFTADTGLTTTAPSTRATRVALNCANWAGAN